MDGNRNWVVTIYGMTDKMPRQYSYTHANDREQALNQVVQKICRDVQRVPGYNKGWQYKDTGFSAVVSPQYAPLIVRHLKENPKRWRAGEVK